MRNMLGLLRSAREVRERMAPGVVTTGRPPWIQNSVLVINNDPAGISSRTDMLPALQKPAVVVFARFTLLGGHEAFTYFIPIKSALQ